MQIEDGRVLLAGGASSIRSAATEVYDPARYVLNATVTFAPLPIGADLRSPIRVWSTFEPLRHRLAVATCLSPEETAILL